MNEMRRIRRAYGERFGNDLHAICEDLRGQERQSDREFRTLSQGNVDQAAGEVTQEKTGAKTGR